MSSESRKLWASMRPPLLYYALARAEGWRMWPDKALDKALGDPERWRCCHLCGRREDFLFNFANLVDVWDDESERVVRECRWHGPKVLMDCRTGEEVVVPDPPKWPWLRRLLEGVMLYLAISVRFCWFSLVGLFWRLVASNDVTFALVGWAYSQVRRKCESRRVG